MLSAPGNVHAGAELTYTVHLTNSSPFALNGTQVRLLLPRNLTFTGTTSDTISIQGREIVVTVGRLAAGTDETISIPTVTSSGSDDPIQGSAQVYSSTALPMATNTVKTRVIE
jgi:uncharacterized repeat protein (TIGR01451 family)